MSVQLEGFNLFLIRTDGARQSVVLLAWEQDPDNPDRVRLSLLTGEREITRVGTDYFAAMRAIRQELEKEGELLVCNGASRNVCPSGMILSMGPGDKAYKLRLGQPARLEDLVSIFDVDDDVQPVTIAEQDSFYNTWLSSLAGQH
jgi:hypothetical protein